MAKKLGTYQNSARSLRIDVSDNDIKKGKKLDPHSCAAAVAIMRSTKASEVSVHRGVTYITIGKVTRRYRTSSGLRLETIVFDRGGEFMPGEYDLKPVPLSALIPRKKKSNGSKGKSPKEAALSLRRRVIPGVRRSARAREEDTEDGNA